MRISKPCKFEGMAKTWKGFENWRFGSTGTPYAQLEKDIGANSMMDVYVDMDPDAYLENSP